MKSTRYQGPAWRLHNPSSHWDAHSMEHARYNGGRFNPPGSPALYLSLKPSTLKQELGVTHVPGLHTSLQLCTFTLDIEGIVDLRHGYERLFRAPWRLMAMQGKTPPGWSIYKAAERVEGVRGILVPSLQQPGEANLVLLHWEGEELKLLDCTDPDSPA